MELATVIEQTMNANPNSNCQSWYDQSYRGRGFAAQRLYPNEELLRFFGRHYFPLSLEQRCNVRILEVGCGSGANLWMIAREGFEAHGVDLSLEGLNLAAKMLARWGTTATLMQADMTSIPYPDQHFDAVLDVFSSCCLNEKAFGSFADEAVRLLRRGGRFFSYTPSRASDAFVNPGSADFIDVSTLNGISRKDSAYFGCTHPVRFTTREEYAAALSSRGLRVVHNEVVGRTYRDGDEYFEFVVIAGEKPGT